jgi:hypothetical protein
MLFTLGVIYEKQLKINFNADLFLNLPSEGKIVYKEFFFSYVLNK